MATGHIVTRHYAGDGTDMAANVFSFILAHFPLDNLT